MEDREIRVIERNVEGRIKSKVLKNLELNVPNLRGYLDRKEPNIEGALSMVKRLEELIEELQ